MTNERHDVLQIKDLGPISKCITTSKQDFPQVFFISPTRLITKHLRSLFISAWINGVPFKKALIDGGDSVNILPYKRLEKLGKSKTDLIPTDLTVSNFVETITATYGILIVELEVGSKTLLDSTSSYHALMGRDWIY